MLCFKCNLELEPSKVNLEYIGHRVVQEFLRCPGCGNMFIPESDVLNKMQKVEMALEDK